MMDFSNLSLYDQKRIDEHVFHMESRGYDCFDNFFDESVCNYLRERLEIAILNYKSYQESERSFLDKYHMHDLLNRDLLFAKTLEDPRLQQIIASVLGDFWIMYAYTSSSLPPDGSNYGSRIHVDCPRWIANYQTNLGVIWALDDFTIENGATYVLPGTHNTKLEPTEEVFETNSVRLTCKKGSLLVFNARVWHRAGINLTNQFRHALTMNICRPYMKQRMDWVRFIDPEITDKLNSQARRIIGFDTRIPSSLEEFFLPEEKRFYKPNQG